MMKKSKSKLLYFGAVLGVLAIVGVALLYSAFYGKALEKETDVYVGATCEYSEIVEQLSPSFRSGLHRKAFAIYASRLNLSERYHTGYYKFTKKESAIRMVRRMVLGEQDPVKLVIGSSRTLSQLANKLAKQIDADTMALLSAMRNLQIRKELGFVNDSIIAMFIPNTYEVYWNVAPEQLMRRMHKEYKRFWNEERTAKLKRCGLSKYEVMTLAAIVTEETRAREEMPSVAGVYINRLRKNMRLQADPTVKYAIGDFALRRILNKHLKYESPFNTYLNLGLPPAPICIPTIAAIDGVLNFKEHNYLFFCARPEFDGRHNFARTWEEHKANARKYAEALNKRGIK